MTINNFIPSVWSALVLKAANDKLVYGSLCNRDYEGDISQMGDSVKINAIGRVTIGSYTKNSNISAAETLTDAQTTLTIDKADYFNFQVDNVDKAQVKGAVMEAAMEDAAWGLANKADEYLAALHSETPAANKIGADAGSAKLGLVLTAGSAMYDYLTQLAVILDDNNTPDDGKRWVVVPNWAAGVMTQDSRFINATQAGNDIRTTGYIGKAAGFNIFKSNNVTNDAQTVPTYRIMAGHPKTIALADQINEVAAYKPELRFGDAVKGLHLYGFKVVRPSMLATLYVKNAAT